MANEHGKLLSWKFFSRFSITTPATRWDLAAVAATRNWFNSNFIQRACGWQCPQRVGRGWREFSYLLAHHLLPPFMNDFESRFKLESVPRSLRSRLVLGQRRSPQRVKGRRCFAFAWDHLGSFGLSTGCS